MNSSAVTDVDRYFVLDKSTGSPIRDVPSHTAEDVNRAVVSARTGFFRWSKTPAHERARVLRGAAERMNLERDSLADELARETGKVLKDALAEIDSTVRIFTGYAEESTRHFGQAIELERQAGLERDLMITRHEPLGVVVAITPFNFPAEMFAQKASGALAAGNAVIVKPAEANPLTAIRLSEILHAEGVPIDALQVLTGAGRSVAKPLSEHPGIDAITFTGSTFVGREIATAAAQNLIPATLELGGNDAFIVAADADLELAVEEALVGRTSSNGQVCVATKRIIVVREVEETFTTLLLDRVSRLKVGGALEEGATVGPLISERAAETVERQVFSAVAEGAELLHGGARDGAFYYPAVLKVPATSSVAHSEEIFGPVFSIIAVDTLGDAVALANDSDYGLNAAVFTETITDGYAAAEDLQAAIVSINGGNLYRPDGSSFGGYKKSGLGREGFFGSLEEFTQVKTIALRGFRRG